MNLNTIESSWRGALQNESEGIFIAQVLLAEAIKKTRAYLYSYPQQILSPIEKEQFDSFIARYKSGEPLAYIIGSTEFYSLSFKVNQDVLIPRHETELLIDLIVPHLKSLSQPTILDLGTGSGAIAITLAHLCPNAFVIASDISQKALSLAKENAARYHLTNIQFIESNWYQNLPPLLFDCIISNPPYLSLSEWQNNKGLHQEPPAAFVGKEDGFDSYRQILKKIKLFLKKNGHLYLEHGSSQKETIAQMLIENGLKNLGFFKDLNGHDRVISAHNS